jgi:hypothetical protein
MLASSATAASTAFNSRQRGAHQPSAISATCCEQHSSCGFAHRRQHQCLNFSGDDSATYNICSSSVDIERHRQQQCRRRGFIVAASEHPLQPLERCWYDRCNRFNDECSFSDNSTDCCSSSSSNCSESDTERRVGALPLHFQLLHSDDIVYFSNATSSSSIKF